MCSFHGGVNKRNIDPIYRYILCTSPTRKTNNRSIPLHNCHSHGTYRVVYLLSEMLIFCWTTYVYLQPCFQIKTHGNFWLFIRSRRHQSRRCWDWVFHRRIWKRSRSNFRGRSHNNFHRFWSWHWISRTTTSILKRRNLQWVMSNQTAISHVRMYIQSVHI